MAAGKTAAKLAAAVLALRSGEVLGAAPLKVIVPPKEPHVRCSLLGEVGLGRRATSSADAAERSAPLAPGLRASA